MKNGSEHIDQLITRFLSGEASSKEVQELQNWMDSSGSNQKYFNHFKFVNEKAIASYPYKKYDADKAWDKLKSQMNNPSVKKFPITRSLNQRFWLRVAAGIIVLIGISVLIVMLQNPNVADQEIVALTAVDTTKKEILADNTEIVLNKNSTITYAKDFGKKNREVKLTGEAYFKVEHIDNKPFTVDAGGVYIKDIGTAFNIKAYPESSKVDVFVESGEIEIYISEKSGKSVKQGEGIIFSRADSSFTMYYDDNNLLAYKTHVFRFNDVPLNEVVNKLNSVYRTQIRLLNKNLGNCRITVMFNDEKIDNIVQVISETLSLQVVVDDKGFALKGNACVNE